MRFGRIQERIKTNTAKKYNIFRILHLFSGLNTGIKPAVVYRIVLAIVKKKSLAKCPVTVQSGQKIYAKIRK
jgi:hypothetical protein